VPRGESPKGTASLPAPRGPGGTPAPQASEGLIAEAMRLVVSGLDVDALEDAVGDMVRGLREQAKVLADPDQYAPHPERCPKCKADEQRREKCQVCLGEGVITVYPDTGAVAKAMKATGDTADTMVRLAQFAKGNPDSRPELLGKDFLALLTDAELQELERRARARQEAQK
jgi:hypothetical protein